jgi:hypothetical protein
MEETVERAHRACEKCTRTKKKCDKAMPACSRCVRFAISPLTVPLTSPCVVVSVAVPNHTLAPDLTLFRGVQKIIYATFSRA